MESKKSLAGPGKHAILEEQANAVVGLGLAVFPSRSIICLISLRGSWYRSNVNTYCREREGRWGLVVGGGVGGGRTKGFGS